MTTAKLFSVGKGVKLGTWGPFNNGARLNIWTTRSRGTIQYFFVCSNLLCFLFNGYLDTFVISHGNATCVLFQQWYG